MKRISLKSVNAHIQITYPLLYLVKGNGYFWVHSDDERVALQLARLFTTGIDIPKLSMATPERWLELVKFVLADSERFESERSPVVFPVNQLEYTHYICEIIEQSVPFPQYAHKIVINEGFTCKEDGILRLNEQKLEGNTNGLLFKVYSWAYLTSKGVSPWDDANWGNPSYMK